MLDNCDYDKREQVKESDKKERNKCMITLMTRKENR